MTLPILSADRVSGVTRRLEMAMTTVRSPFNGKDQTQDWGGRWWAYDVQLGPWRDPGAKRAIAAFFAGLDATAGKFLFADPSAPFKGDYAGLGSPLVRGGLQTGRQLVTDGWPAHALLRAGMCISFATGSSTRFHMLTQNATASASGIATLVLAPILRDSPADNAVIEYAAPKVQLRVTSAVAAQIASGAYTTFSFTAEESL